MRIQGARPVSDSGSGPGRDCSRNVQGGIYIPAHATPGFLPLSVFPVPPHALSFLSFEFSRSRARRANEDRATTSGATAWTNTTVIADINGQVRAHLRCRCHLLTALARPCCRIIARATCRSRILRPCLALRPPSALPNLYLRHLLLRSLFLSLQ